VDNVLLADHSVNLYNDNLFPQMDMGVMMTLEEVQKLTDDELRIKVAELCPLNKWADLEWALYRTRTHTNPNYTQDLNAMHEAEKLLNDVQYAEYSRFVGAGHTGARHGLTDKCAAMFATARQRAEAFVLTMEEL
jgi:hypothetical protein